MTFKKHDINLVYFDKTCYFDKTLLRTVHVLHLVSTCWAMNTTLIFVTVLLIVIVVMTIIWCGSLDTSESARSDDPLQINDYVTSENATPAELFSLRTNTLIKAVNGRTVNYAKHRFASDRSRYKVDNDSSSEDKESNEIKGDLYLIGQENNMMELHAHNVYVTGDKQFQEVELHLGGKGHTGPILKRFPLENNSIPDGVLWSYRDADGLTTQIVEMIRSNVTYLACPGHGPRAEVISSGRILFSR